MTEDPIGRSGMASHASARSAAESLVAALPVVATDAAGGDLTAIEHAILDSISAAVVVTDVAGRVQFWNAAAERLMGFEPGAMRAADVAVILVDRERQLFGTEVLDQVLAGQPWTGDFAITGLGGQARTLRVTNSPLRRAGRVTGVVAVVEDITSDPQLRDDADVYAVRLRRLARVTAELAAAADTDAVVEIAVAHVAAAVGASMASLSMLQGDTLTLIASRGGQAETGRRWATYPLAADVPAAEAVRTRQPVIVPGRDAIVARYPMFAGDIPDERSLVCLPLVVRERAMGAVALVFAGYWAPDDRELEFMKTFADTCAQALDRLEALERARDTTVKLAFLADASAELAASLDYRATLAKLARLAVPTLADWCAVDIVEDGQIRTLAVAHVDPAKVALAEELQRRYPLDPEARTGIPQVLRTGRSEWLPQITDEMLQAGARDEEHLRLARELQLRSAVVVPLTARDRVLGTLTLVSAESAHVYDEEDVRFAEDLARRAAIAIDNAQLHSETLEAAVRLQHAVLPERLPHVDGWEIASHYQPAGRTDIGGDFYDAIPTGDGNVALVLGDVMGRGVAAAAAMAQMRAAVRAYAALDPDPKAVLDGLDRLFSNDEIAQLVTLVYGLTDRARGELVVINAGHLPALRLLGPDAELLRLPVSLPLGVGPDTREPVRIAFPAGATFLAFTDGLVERRDEDIDAGLGRIREHARLLPDGPLDVQLQALVDAMCSPRGEAGGYADATAGCGGSRGANDDVTLLGLRRVGP